MTKIADLPVAPPVDRHVIHVERHLFETCWLAAIDDVGHGSRMSARLMLMGLEADHVFAGYTWNTPTVLEDRLVAVALTEGGMTIVTVSDLDALRVN